MEITKAIGMAAQSLPAPLPLSRRYKLREMHKKPNPMEKLIGEKL